MHTETRIPVAAIRRDEAFWQSAYRAHGPAVMGFLLRRLRRREEAEDLLQETFVRAMRVDSFEGGNLRGYLLRIARNLLINRLRRPRVVVPAETPEEGRFAEVAAHDAGPERESHWRAFEARLEEALEHMKEDHRRAFRMAVMEQYSYAEVARLTGWSLGTVKSNVHRARRKLVAQLGDYLPASRGESP